MTMPDATALERLQKWYLARCNGKWEHSWGVEIGTLDNPGWRARIDLNATPKENAVFAHVENHRSESDWIVYWAEKKRFHIACGPENLAEAINLFIDWYESN